MAHTLATLKEGALLLSQSDGGIIVKVGAQTHDHRIAAGCSHAFANPGFETGDFPVVLHGENRIDVASAQPVGPILSNPIMGNQWSTVHGGGHEDVSSLLPTALCDHPNHLCDLIPAPIIPCFS